MTEAQKNKYLVGVYREAFGWTSEGGVGPSQRAMMNDLEEFCGLRQAKFTGSEADRLTQLGRVEVMGRINFFLKFTNDEMQKVNDVIKADEETDNE